MRVFWSRKLGGIVFMGVMFVIMPVTMFMDNYLVDVYMTMLFNKKPNGSSNHQW